VTTTGPPHGYEGMRLKLDIGRRLAFVPRAWRVLLRAAPDRWDVLTVAGSASLGAGIWLRFGLPWALMAWGVLALAPVVTHGLALAAADRARLRGGE
jgi:hypothetical protein